MEPILNAIQNTPLPTILTVAGLLFLLLGFVTKLGGFIEVSREQKRWTIPIGLLVLTIGLVLHSKTPAPSPTAVQASTATPATSSTPVVSPAAASTPVASTPETTKVESLPTSSYQDSCDNIAISGNVLSADCRKKDGQFVQSSIVLRGIENADGVLMATSSDQPSSYQDSCDDISISGNTLSAICKTKAGMQNQTTLTLDGIQNTDGVLTYTGNP